MSMIWKPFEFKNYSIILLNQPVQNEEYFSTLWNNASTRMLVDGGGNQWDKIRKLRPDLKLPHLVSGDFDSINKPLLEEFQSGGNQNIEIFETPDQNETDFTKALRILKDKLNLDKDESHKILAFCECSGRFDQIMGNIETLFHSLKIFSPNQHVYLLGSTSMSWLLRKEHENIICLSGEQQQKIDYCSLIPVGTPSRVTTQGLQWDLTDDILAFGTLISSSNKLKDQNVKEVCIKTSENILWSMEVSF